MPILRKIKRKENGVEETVHLGALAQNITQDATHRFVTDTEKQAWNSKPGSTSGLDNNVVTFTEAATRENLQSGEKLSISLGKIKKWFSDLGAAAFMAVANNCTTTQPGSVLAAEQGKKLQDQISQVSSDLGGCRFGYTEDGLPGYKKDGADTVYPFSSVRSISGVFSAYLPAGNMECHTIISRPENTSIKKITIQINRQIAGQTYIRVISNKGDTPTTIAQYSFAVQPPVLNQDIPFDISDNPDNIEIQAQTIPAGIMQQTNVPYTIEFSHTGT